MSLLEKAYGELTEADKDSLYKPVGTSGIPYPGVRAEIRGDNDLDIEIGMIADDESPIPVISTRPHDQVVALAYSNMAAPCALLAERELFEQMRLDSNNLFTLVLGIPGWGKTQLAENTAQMMDDRGFIFLNCAERNLEEILWETVIDVGEDYKTAIRNRLRQGSLLPDSRKLLEENFEAALIKNGNGKIVDIDLSKAAIKAADDQKTIDLIRKNTEIFKAIAENEGIPLQSSNVLGIRKIPGPLKRAYDEGRILITDEFTKGQDGSESQLLEFLQWASGMGRDEIKIKSTMSVNGQDETTEYTLRRSERKSGFRVVATGNLTDPMMSREESSPIFSRITKIKVGLPSKMDWEHRVSQVLTGTPLSTHVAFFSAMAHEDADDFGALLLDWRQTKADVEGREVPVRQVMNIRNWQQTRQAVGQIAESFHFVERLLDPTSDLHDPNKPQSGLYDGVRNETRAGFAAANPIDPRLFIRLVLQAEQARASVQKVDTNTGAVPKFNPAAVGRKASLTKAKNSIVAQADFGKHLQEEIENWIGTLTSGMPETRKAIVKEMRERGVAFTLPDQKNTVASFLNQDMFAHIGGIKSIVALREILAKRMRQSNPSLRGSTDNDLIPMDEAAALCEQLSRLPANDSANPNVGRIVTLGNDAKNAFNQAAAIDGIVTEKHKPKKPAASQLLRVGDFLDTLKVPTLANINMRSIWRKTLSNDNILPRNDAYAQLAQIAEGTHKSKIGITTVMTQDDNGEAAPMHVMIDGERKKSLIVADGVDAETKAALGKDYTVVSFGDKDAEEQVAAFIRDTLRHGTRRDQSAELEGQLAAAFLFRAGDTANTQTLAKMMSSKDTQAKAPVYMVQQLG